MISRHLVKQLRTINNHSSNSNVHLHLNLNSIQSANKARLFSSTPAIMVKAGDSIPTTELVENSPGNTVNLAKELAGSNGLIIGVPAAFSTSSPYQPL